MTRSDHTERLREFLDICEELYGQEGWERFLTEKSLDRVCSGKILKKLRRIGTLLTWAINFVLLMCWRYNREPYMPVFMNEDVDDYSITLQMPIFLRQASFLQDDAVSKTVHFERINPLHAPACHTKFLHHTHPQITTPTGAPPSFPDYNCGFCSAESRPVAVFYSLLRRASGGDISSVLVPSPRGGSAERPQGRYSTSTSVAECVGALPAVLS